MKNCIVTFLFAVLLLLLGSEAAWCMNNEDGRSGDFYLSATVGGYPFNNPQGLKGEVFYGLKFGYDIPGIGIVDSLGVEAFAASTQIWSDSESDEARLYQLRIDTIHLLGVNKRLTPFLALGGGWVHADGDTVADDGAIVALGVGAKYALTNYLRLRADFRNMIWFAPGQDNYFEGSVGLSYVFGQKRIKKPQPPPDTDRDGVVDGQDQCPDTPRGLRVDKQGCPTDSSDIDGDQVPDFRDECNATPTGTPVDQTGCPKDSDGDSIPDFRDRCSGTPAGVETDNNGCVKRTGPGTSSIAEPWQMSSRPDDKEKPAGETASAGPIEVLPAEKLPLVVPGAPASTVPGVAVSDLAPASNGSAAGERSGLSEIVPATVDALPAAAASDSELEMIAEPFSAQTKFSDLPLSPAGLITPDPGEDDVSLARPKEHGDDKFSDSIRVEFDFDRAKVQENFRGPLAAVAERMRATKQRVLIEAHTDSLGSHAYNDRLSVRRAHSVKRELEQLGVDPAWISAVGYGERRPIADNATEPGRQRNRRAMIFFRRGKTDQ